MVMRPAGRPAILPRRHRLASLGFEQVARAGFDGQRGETARGPSGMDRPGVPPDAPPGADRHPAAIWSSYPALARDDQEKLRARRGVRSDNSARRHAQARQPDAAGTRCDPRGVQSPAAVTLDDSFPAVELEDLHLAPITS